MKLARSIVGLAAFALLPACNGWPTGPDLTRIGATVFFNGLEGGFYALRGDNGAGYDPVNLATDYRREGLRVIVALKPRPDMASVHMWGQIVEIVEIQTQ